MIIPTYGHREFVLAAIESVFTQTYKKIEIIVVNDGSPDGSSELLRPLAQSGLIIYREQANLGQAAARNHGLAIAQGDFIAFLDDDDIWPPDKLEWQIDVITRLNCDAVGGTAGTIIDEEKTPPAGSFGGINRISALSLFNGSPFHSPGQVLIRRSALVSLGGLDEEIWGCDDFDLYFRLAAIGTIVQVQRCALYYRRHALNASTSVDRMFWSSLAVIRKHLHSVPMPSRRNARRAGYLWLYRYAGQRFINKSLRCTPRRYLDASRIILVMLSPALTNVVLAKDLVRDLTPTYLRQLRRRLSEQLVAK